MDFQLLLVNSYEVKGLLKTIKVLEDRATVIVHGKPTPQKNGRNTGVVFLSPYATNFRDGVYRRLEVFYEDLWLPNVVYEQATIYGSDRVLQRLEHYRRAHPHLDDVLAELEEKTGKKF